MAAPPVARGDRAALGHRGVDAEILMPIGRLPGRPACRHRSRPSAGSADGRLAARDAFLDPQFRLADADACGRSSPIPPRAPARPARGCRASGGSTGHGPSASDRSASEASDRIETEGNSLSVMPAPDADDPRRLRPVGGASGATQSRKRGQVAAIVGAERQIRAVGMASASPVRVASSRTRGDRHQRRRLGPAREIGAGHPAARSASPPHAPRPSAGPRAGRRPAKDERTRGLRVRVP